MTTLKQRALQLTCLQALRGGRRWGLQPAWRWNAGAGCLPLSSSGRSSTSKPSAVTEAADGELPFPPPPPFAAAKAVLLVPFKQSVAVQKQASITAYTVQLRHVCVPCRCRFPWLAIRSALAQTLRAFFLAILVSLHWITSPLSKKTAG